MVLVVAAGAGQQEGAVADVVLRVDVGAAADESLRGLVIALSNGQQQWSAPAWVTRVGVPVVF